MSDYNSWQEEVYKSVMDVTKRTNEILEKKIEEVVTKYDCKPSQIRLKVMPNLKYEIHIKAEELCFEYFFTINVDD